MRRTTFTVDASSVQGNEGAEVTFSCITVGQRQEYLDTDINDIDMVRIHIVSWSGIQDNDGHDFPSPADDPAVVNALYMHEIRELSRLLWAGPDGASAKN